MESCSIWCTSHTSQGPCSWNGEGPWLSSKGRSMSVEKPILCTLKHSVKWEWTMCERPLQVLLVEMRSNLTSLVKYNPIIFFNLFWVLHWWGRKETMMDHLEKRGRFLLHQLYIGVCTWLCNMCLICKQWHSMKNRKMPWFWAFALKYEDEWS